MSMTVLHECDGNWPKEGDILQKRQPLVKWPIEIICLREGERYIHMLVHLKGPDKYATYSSAKSHFWGKFEYYKPLNDNEFDGGLGI